MMIQGDNPIIDKLLNGNDAVVFNLVSLIRKQSGARLYTDGNSYLTAQVNADCPMWVYVNANADASTEKELLSIFSEAIESNPLLPINAQQGFTENTLSLFAEQRGLTISKRVLNAYYIKQVNDIAPIGKMITASDKYEKDIAVLIQQAAVDDCDGDMTDEQAIQFAKAHANTGNLYLWLQGGAVSMARVVRYDERFARLTSIVTERAARGNGYAKMLVGEISKRLLAEGVTPMLYARAENPSSNRCYQKLGFEKAGQICEYRLEKQIR